MPLNRSINYYKTTKVINITGSKSYLALNVVEPIEIHHRFEHFNK